MAAYVVRSPLGRSLLAVHKSPTIVMNDDVKKEETTTPVEPVTEPVEVPATPVETTTPAAETPAA
jgi:hypothetical protein